ncbi:MAG: serine/threonine protein kinase [Alphaproteobacteria bacterium]|nr:serine/threonine protein kinase [Alphaproteobacteria bacterium]
MAIRVEAEATLAAGMDLVWRLVSGPEVLRALVEPCVQLQGDETLALETADPSTPPVHLRCRGRITGGSEPRSLTFEALLSERSTGCHVFLELEVELASSFFGFLVQPATRALVARELQQSLEWLAGSLVEDAIAVLRPEPLAPAVAERLREVLADRPSEAREALIRRLERAPAAVTSTLRPREIAVQEGLPLADVLSVLVRGVATGLLDLEWILMCPDSEMSAAERDRIPDGGAHCARCGIGFDVTTEDSMEAVFRPRPDVRGDFAPVRRVPSPDREPVELVREVFRPGSHRFTAELGVGRHLLRSAGARGVFDVGPEHPPADEVLVHYTDDGVTVTPGRGAPGDVRFLLVNERSDAVDLTLVRAWRPFRPLTAASWLRDPDIRDPLAAAILGPSCEALGGMAIVAEGANVEARRRVQAIFEELAGPDRVAKLSSTRIAAAFADGATAFAAMEQAVARQIPVGMGVGTGVVTRLGPPRIRLVGEAVMDAEQALTSAGPPQIAVHDRAVPVVEAVIAAYERVVTLQQRPGKPGLLAFAAVIDGAPDLEIAILEPLPEQFEATPLTSIRGMPIVAELDQGGVGAVVEVEDASGRKLAAKVIHPHLADERYRQLFYKEGYYASQIRHPNVVEVLEWGEEEGRPFLLMERLYGHTLFHEVRKVAPLSLARTRDVMVALLDGLSAIHALGLVHRDVKPHNVFLLDAAGEVPYGVKLLDFGLMRRAGKSAQERFAGTPEFMAPEQLVLGSVDARTDVYSVGALAYFAHLGRVPFRGRTRGEGAVQRLEGALRDDLDPSLLGPLADIVVKAMAVEPDERWSTAEAMRDALVALDLSTDVG